jgi:Flp pilus assembly protein TadD
MPAYFCNSSACWKRRRSDYFEASMKLADELAMRPQTAHCHLGLGRHYQRIGEHDSARQHLSAALSMYREMHTRYWPEQAEAELNRLS